MMVMMTMLIIAMTIIIMMRTVVEATVILFFENLESFVFFFRSLAKNLPVEPNFCDKRLRAREKGLEPQLQCLNNV